MKGSKRRTRPLQADKPCRECGQPIHYTYSGPIQGVCGRCTDKRNRRRRRVRPYHRATVVRAHPPTRRSTGPSVATLIGVMVVGAVVVAVAINFLLG
ncbi:MAG: hypothetical protein ACYTHK_17200 [Planctomycetota bacterium]|jgi:hypothetical protein